MVVITREQCDAIIQTIEEHLRMCEGGGRLHREEWAAKLFLFLVKNLEWLKTERQLYEATVNKACALLNDTSNPPLIEAISSFLRECALK